MEHSDKHLLLVWTLEAVEIASPTRLVKQKEKKKKKKLNFTEVSCLDLSPLGGQKTAFFLFYYVCCPSSSTQEMEVLFKLPTAVNKLFPLFSLSCMPGK